MTNSFKPAAFKNYHVDAYLEGRLDEVPAECLEAVKDVAARRNKAEAPKEPKAEAPRGWGFLSDDEDK